MRTRQKMIPVYYRWDGHIKEQNEAEEFEICDIIPYELPMGARYVISQITVRRGSEKCGQ